MFNLRTGSRCRHATSKLSKTKTTDGLFSVRNQFSSCLTGPRSRSAAGGRERQRGKWIPYREKRTDWEAYNGISVKKSRSSFTDRRWSACWAHQQTSRRPWHLLNSKISCCCWALMQFLLISVSTARWYIFTNNSVVTVRPCFAVYYIYIYISTHWHKLQSTIR